VPICNPCERIFRSHFVGYQRFISGKKEAEKNFRENLLSKYFSAKLHVVQIIELK
jgi:hypothetical protein